MAIDPNIILSLNRGQTTSFDPMTFFRAKEAAELGRAREQQNALALQENERKVAAEQRALAQEEELKSLYAQGGTPDELSGRLLTAGYAEPAFKVQKAGQEAGAFKIDSATKQRNHIKALLEDGIARPDLPNVMGIIDRAEADFGVDLSNERQTLMQLPTDEERKLYLMRLNLPLEKQLPKTETIKGGGYNTRLSTDPLTGKEISRERFEETASPDARLAAQTAANELKFKREKLTADTEAAKAKAAASGIKLSKSDEARDKQFALKWGTFNEGGGIAGAEKSLAQLNEAATALENDPTLSGGWQANLPDAAQALLNPERVATRNRVEEIVQENLKLILGGQFAQKEAEALIARAYNEKLPAPENAKRVRRLMKRVSEGAKSMQDAGAYYDEHGTLKGWKGREPKLSDFYDAIEGVGVGDNGKSGAPGAKSVGKGAGGVRKLTTEEEAVLGKY